MDNIKCANCQQLNPVEDCAITGNRMAADEPRDCPAFDPMLIDFVIPADPAAETAAETAAEVAP